MVDMGDLKNLSAYPVLMAARRLMDKELFYPEKGLSRISLN